MSAPKLINLCSRDIVVEHGSMTSFISKHPTPLRVRTARYGSTLSEFVGIDDIAWPVWRAHYEPQIVWPDDLPEENKGLYVIVDPEVAVCVRLTDADEKPLFSVWTPIVDIITTDDGPLSVDGFIRVH